MQKLFGTEIFSYKRFSYSLNFSAIIISSSANSISKNNIEPDLTFGCAQILSFNPSCPFLAHRGPQGPPYDAAYDQYRPPLPNHAPPTMDGSEAK